MKDAWMAKAGRITGACAAGAALACAACSDPLSVFQERPDDLARRLPAERTRSTPGLDVEQFRRLPVPTADLSADAMVAQAAKDVAAAVDGAGAQGGPRVEWSLERVRALAISNNLELKVFVIDPAIAEQTVQRERAKFDAVFRPGGTVAKTDRPNTNTTSVTQLKGASGSAMVDIPLRTGGTLSVGGELGYDRADNAFVSFPSTYSTRMLASLSLPLMQGSGRDVNTASIKIAGYEADIASAGTRLQVTGILAEVERTYWRLVSVRKQLEVAKQQFELARNLLERAKRRVDAGDAAQIEVTRAQSGLASRVDAVIRAETAVLVQQRALKRRVADPAVKVDGPEQVLATTAPDLWSYELPAERLLKLAEANRMELLQSELQLLSDALTIDLASDATRPVLNVLANYDFAGATSAFDSSFHQMAEGHFQSWSLGVQGSVPFTNGAAEAGLRRAILQRMRTLATLDSQRDTVKGEVLDALDRVESAWQRITASQLASLLATRALEAETRQFDRGARTSTDVLNAATDLADAQTNEVLAVGEYRIALVDLAVATGTVLGGAGVTWEPVPAPPLSGDRLRGLRPAGEPRRAYQPDPNGWTSP